MTERAKCLLGGHGDRSLAPSTHVGALRGGSVYNPSAGESWPGRLVVSANWRLSEIRWKTRGRHLM